MSVSFDGFTEIEMGRDLLSKYIQSLPPYVEISREEEEKLFLKIAAGDLEARNVIVKNSLRLVVFFVNRLTLSSHVMLEIISECNLQIFKAIKHFDISRGFRFSSLLGFMIEKRMMSVLGTLTGSYVLILPECLRKKAGRVRRLSNEYYSLHGEMPSIEYIASELKVKVAIAKKILFLSQEGYGYNCNCDDEDGLTLEENIADDKELVLEQIIKLEKEMCLKKGIKKLSSRERDVIEMYFGLSENFTSCAFSEISTTKKMTQAQVTEAYESALSKLFEHFCDEGFIRRSYCSKGSIEKIRQQRCRMIFADIDKEEKHATDSQQ